MFRQLKELWLHTLHNQKWWTRLQILWSSFEGSFRNAAPQGTSSWQAIWNFHITQNYFCSFAFNIQGGTDSLISQEPSDHWKEGLPKLQMRNSSWLFHVMNPAGIYTTLRYTKAPGINAVPSQEGHALVLPEAPTAWSQSLPPCSGLLPSRAGGKLWLRFKKCVWEMCPVEILWISSLHFNAFSNNFLSTILSGWVTELQLCQELQKRDLNHVFSP